MKNILNKIGMFLIKKLHLLLVITHFKRTVEYFKKTSNKLRLMFIKTLKKVLENQLQTYYLEFNFMTLDHLNYYKLPIICYLVDEDESINLYNNIYEQLKISFHLDGGCKRQKIMSKKHLKRTEEIIRNTQGIQGYKTLKLELERMKIINSKVYYEIEDKNEDIKEFRINIVKTGGIPFQNIKDQFVIKIDKSILEDNYLDPDKDLIGQK